MLTLQQLWDQFRVYADDHYRKPKTKRPTGEVTNLDYAFRHVLHLFGNLPADQFTPLKLRAVRDAMIASGLCRNSVNDRVRRIRTVMAWATGLELVPGHLIEALRCVPALAYGRSAAPETEPVGPADPEAVAAVLPFLSPTLRCMVEVQRLTGMRPGELCAMQWSQIDRRDKVWLYTPAEHKTEHRRQPRVVALGRRAQELLTQRQADQVLRREHKLSELVFTLPHPRKRREDAVNTEESGGSCSAVPLRGYNAHTYALAIRRACLRAGLPDHQHWHPNQLRHNAACAIESAAGMDSARAVLGHHDLKTTGIYTHRGNAADLPDVRLAMDVVRRIG